MFAIGDMIIYGGMGVCRVEKIEIKKLNECGDRKFYVLKPLYQNCTVLTPVDNDKVVMRPVISRRQAEDLIETIPYVHAEAYSNKALRQLSEHYEALIKSFDCAELIELTMSIYAKKKLAEKQNKKMGALDERYMKRAEDILFGEFSVALGMERNEVPGYIAKRVALLKSNKLKKAVDM